MEFQCTSKFDKYNNDSIQRQRAYWRETPFSEGALLTFFGQKYASVKKHFNDSN